MYGTGWRHEESERKAQRKWCKGWTDEGTNMGIRWEQDTKHIRWAKRIENGFNFRSKPYGRERAGHNGKRGIWFPLGTLKFLLSLLPLLHIADIPQTEDKPWNAQLKISITTNIQEYWGIFQENQGIFT
jgi:hypothetical protein